MTTMLNLLVLPLRAPMLLLLLVVSTYLGLHWSSPGAWADVGTGGVTDVIWSVECLHSLVVVIVCTMPDLLLRRVSSMMAASRVVSLVLTLLLVTIGGIYLLHLDVLSNVLILGSAVLLARLDLLRLRVLPPPFVMTVILSVLVLGGASAGRGLAVRMEQLTPPVQEARPAAVSPRDPGASKPAAALPAASSEAPRSAGTTRKGDDAGSDVRATGPLAKPAESPAPARPGDAAAAGTAPRPGAHAQGRSVNAPHQAVPTTQDMDNEPVLVP